MKMTNSVFKTGKESISFRDKVVMYAKYSRCDDVLSSTVHIDVGLKTIIRNCSLRKSGVSAADYDRHLKAWVFFDQALVSTAGSGRMRQICPPSLLWEELIIWYAPATVGRRVE